MRCLRVAVASVACCATAYMTHRHGQHRLGASNPHAEHLEPADEMPDIAHEPDGDDADFNPSEQNFNGGISADARAVLQSIDESVLNLAEHSGLESGQSQRLASLQRFVLFRSSGCMATD